MNGSASIPSACDWFRRAIGRNSPAHHKLTSVTPAHPTIAAPEFQRSVEEFSDMQWRRGIKVEEIGSPQRIAPFAIAIAADFEDGTNTLSTGRLILLHDPTGNDSWDGCFRLVSYVHADVDPEMVTDPLLPEAAWSWLTDAMHNHGAAHHVLAGTVTASYGRGFGELTSNQAEVELRSSWSPVLDAQHGLTPHLEAWQDLLGHVAGRPPLPSGVVQFPGRS